MLNVRFVGLVSCVSVVGALAWSSSSASFAQRSKLALVCKKPVLTVLKPVPQLSYQCDGELNDWDEKILKLPARVEAIKKLTVELATFSDPAWWAADVVDLGVCDYAQKVGPLTTTQRHDFLGGEYLFWLFGNERMRLVLVPDPCYQTQYGGSNAFLLYRVGDARRLAGTSDRAGVRDPAPAVRDRSGVRAAVAAARDRIVVTQVLDGYFSRADNSVGLASAKLGAEDIIEISTGSGGLNPTLTNYYFTIDPYSKRATPKNLFLGEHGPTNEITSAMLLESAGPEPLKILRANTLAPTFIIYTDAENGKIRDSGRTLTRQTLRWTGKLYR
jgi:hypothetical protein